ncbi:MAG: MBL fold metallo-hydrolase [Candidatus Atabeyarchaeum deiterrae]|jgi:glyoxylase-like metal-dependent hydrolase (beta-lactamase superfamily II)
MDSLFFRQLKSLGLDNFSYIVGDGESKLAAVVDPPANPNEVLDIVAEYDLKVLYIINTHGHFDHTAGNEKLKKATGAKIVSHESSTVKKDMSVKDGNIIKLDGVRIEVMHTPGHTPDGISLLVQDRLVLTGDTLFVGECGRTDLPGSDPRKMYESLFGRLMKLNDSIEVYPGHDYGVLPYSTIGYEREHNYTLKLRTKEEFVRFMAQP